MALTLKIGGVRENSYSCVTETSMLKVLYMPMQNTSLRRSVNMGITYMHAGDGESFTPIVFSTFGGLGKEAIIFYNHLTDLLSQKHNTSYRQTLSWIHCFVSFSLLRSAIFIIHGSRKTQPVVFSVTSTELCLVESRVLP